MAASNDSAGVPVRGSERSITSGFRDAGPADPQERAQVSVLLRRNPAAAPLPPAHEAATRGHLSREDLAQQVGATDADIQAVTAFAAENGLQVVSADPARRTVVLAGTVEQLQRAFGVELRRFEGPEGTHRGRTGPVHVPASLADVVVGVFGLDDRPQARPHFSVVHPTDKALADAAGPAAGRAMSPIEVGQLYDFPAGLDGGGVTVAVIELGGGFHPADLATYFKNLGLAKPVSVSAVGVDGASNAPSNAQSADSEVCLDIEVIGALAPGAKQVVYFAPNTDRGFIDAITTAVHDAVNRPAIVSISWGGPESSWTQQAMTAMDDAFAEAAALGVTVCVAAGDNGSGDGVNDGRAHVDFPAASPNVLACGGTRLVGNGRTISSETVWNDSSGATGGGISDVFAVPPYQQKANVPPSANPPGTHRGRGVPDVAGNADPVTGYTVQIDGKAMVIGGTSAVAPLWAALVARINQHLGRAIGFVNPLLYALPSPGPVMHDIVKGDNGQYHARPGWDACTGNGTPDGAKLMAALAAAPVAATA